ncbi:uncharacterized protein LOC143035757 [Oratosquilla oratoria]|uniref:uncharacterized protein LOC143035757 n=1 Tax=Oratosquilla oratoria TaxID=337810 RepID=UPI003F75AE71
MEVSSRKTTEMAFSSEKTTDLESEENSGKKRKLNDVESTSEKRFNTGEKVIRIEGSHSTSEKGLSVNKSQITGKNGIPVENSMNKDDKTVASENRMNLSEKRFVDSGKNSVNTDKNRGAGENTTKTTDEMVAVEKGVVDENLNRSGKEVTNRGSVKEGEKDAAGKISMNTTEMGISGKKSQSTNEKGILRENVVKTGGETIPKNISTAGQASVGAVKEGASKPKNSKVLSLLLKPPPKSTVEGNKDIGETPENKSSTSSDKDSQLRNIRLLKLRAQKIMTDNAKDQQNKSDSQKEKESKTKELPIKISGSSSLSESVDKTKRKSNEISWSLEDHASPLGRQDRPLPQDFGQSDGTLLPFDEPCEEGVLPVLTISDTFLTSIYRGKVEMLVIPSAEAFKWKIREDQIRVEKTYESHGEVAIEGPDDDDELSGPHDTIPSHQSNRNISHISSSLPTSKMHRSESVGRVHVVSKDFHKEQPIGKSTKKDGVSALRAVRVPTHNLDKVKGLIKKLNVNKRNVNTQPTRTVRYTSRDFDFIKSNSRQKNPCNITVNHNQLKQSQLSKESQHTARNQGVGSVDTQHKITENKGAASLNKNSANLINNNNNNPGLNKQSKTQPIIVTKQTIEGKMSKPNKEYFSRKEVGTKENDGLSDKSSPEKQVASSSRLEFGASANTKQGSVEGKSGPAERVGVIREVVLKPQNALADGLLKLKTMLQNKENNKEILSDNVICAGGVQRPVDKSSNEQVASTSVNPVFNPVFYPSVIGSCTTDTNTITPATTTTSTTLENTDYLMESTFESVFIKQEENDLADLPEIDSVQSLPNREHVFPNLVQGLASAEDHNTTSSIPELCSSAEQAPDSLLYKVRSEDGGKGSGHQSENLHYLQEEPMDSVPHVSSPSIDSLEGDRDDSAELPEIESVQSLHRKEHIFPNLVQDLESAEDRNITSSAPKLSSAEQAEHPLLYSVQSEEGPKGSGHQPIDNVPHVSSHSIGSLEGEREADIFVTPGLTSPLESLLLQCENLSSTVNVNRTAQETTSTNVCEENILDSDLLNLNVEEVIIGDNTPQAGMPTLDNYRYESEFEGFPASKKKKIASQKKENLAVPSSYKKFKALRGFNRSHGENSVYLEKTREDCPMCYTVIDIKTVVVDMDKLSFTFTCTKCLLVMVFTFEALKKYISEIMGTPEMNFSGLCEFKDWCRETQEKAKLSSKQVIVPKKKKEKSPIMPVYQKTTKVKKEKIKQSKGMDMYKTVPMADFSQGKIKFSSKITGKSKSLSKKTKEQIVSSKLRKLSRDQKDRGDVRFVGLNNKGEVEVSTSF